MFKILKIILLATIIIVFSLGYCIYSWHFKSKPTFLSVDRPCDAVELAKEICLNDNEAINDDCYHGRVPKEGLGYLVRDFLFGHRCTDEKDFKE